MVDVRNVVKLIPVLLIFVMIFIAVYILVSAVTPMKGG